MSKIRLIPSNPHDPSQKLIAKFNHTLAQGTKFSVGDGLVGQPMPAPAPAPAAPAAPTSVGGKGKKTTKKRISKKTVKKKTSKKTTKKKTNKKSKKRTGKKK